MQNDDTGFFESHERKIVFALCFLAALHVLVFSAAFPFFNNVDERFHFDLVLKYARGGPPIAFALFDNEAAHDIAFYGSPEYIFRPAYFTSGEYPPPPWKDPDKTLQQIVSNNESNFKSWSNYECTQPPLYYLLAAGWWEFGKTIGLEEIRLLYWLRFLNVLLVAYLVRVGYAVTREVFPDKIFLRLGVPAILAFLPQTAFYSVDNDILSPLCFGVLLLFLLRWSRAEVPEMRAGIAVGLGIAATFLAKISNLPLLILASFAVILKIWQLGKSGKLSATWKSLVALFCFAAVPMATWMAWCKVHFGDFTGSAANSRFYGWTVKPFADWWQHPLFTPAGFWVFLFRSISTFWRGEFTWNNLPLYFLPADLGYVMLTIFFTVATSLMVFRRLSGVSHEQWQVLSFSLVCFVSMIFFFAFLSIIYDFHNWPYPSQKEPYFTSGRLMLGALVPFLLFFVFQLDHFLYKRSTAAKFVALAGFVLLMLVSEIATDWPVFSSSYNLYHL